MSIPRRNRADLYTPAERAISEAVQEVEKMPAAMRLTEATILLQRARECVADFVDGVDQIAVAGSTPKKLLENPLNDVGSCRCGHNFTVTECPYEFCGYRETLRVLCSLLETIKHK